MPPQTPDPQNPTPAPNPVPQPAAPTTPPAPMPVPVPVPQPVAPVSTPVPAPMPPATASGHVDLGKILLPKKETPGQTTDSAQRVNAGVLFEQEKAAAESPLPQTPKPEAPAATQPPVPKPEQPLVRPLQTYQGDIESLVGEKQVSVVSIAAAEAERRGMQPLEEKVASEGRPWIKKTLVVTAGILLLCIAGGGGFYIYTSMQPVPLSQQAPAPFIFVDDTTTIVLQPSDQRQQIMEALVVAKRGIALSLGLVGRIQVAKPSPLGDGSLAEVSAPEFLQAFAPSIPAQLVRTIEPQMLLGVHSFDENQAFMILKADSYETAYSGMLAWEDSLYEDMSPLFARTPAVRTQAPPPFVPTSVPTTTATTTATTTTSVASTSQASTSTQSSTSTPAATAVAPAPFFRGNFVDKIVENRDARVMLNLEGDILLLWTMLDRSTIVITNNEATLREIISRLSQASILSLPPSR